MSGPGGFDTVLVVDFGAQYAQLIARRVRECHVYSEIVPSTMPVSEMLAKQPKAIILSGGPSSVYAEGAPASPAGLFDAGVPVFGICYGHQVMAQELGGTVEPTGAAEYGGTPLHVLSRGGRAASRVGPELSVWMSHGDTSPSRRPASRSPRGPRRTPVAAFEDPERGLYGVQFHPEVMHTEYGTQIFRRFLEAAGCRPTWTMVNIVEEQTDRIREQVGGGRAICGLSGGVDSAVAAALVQRAIGERLTCVFVDHGLLRKGEAEQVEQDFVAATGVRLHVVDAAAGSSARSPGSPTRRRSGRSSAASSSAPSSARPATSPARPARTASRPSSSCRARSTRTWSSRAAAPGPRTSSRITTWAGCPTT